MNIVAQVFLKKYVEEKDRLLAENAELKKKYELERRKSTYWIMKSYGETHSVIGSKEDIEYITNGVIHTE